MWDLTTLYPATGNLKLSFHVSGKSQTIGMSLFCKKGVVRVLVGWGGGGTPFYKPYRYRYVPPKGYGFCRFGLKTGAVIQVMMTLFLRGQVWKRVWKMIFLVWNRFRIWRTGRHTHKELPGVPPGCSGNWAEDQRPYSGSGGGTSV